MEEELLGERGLARVGVADDGERASASGFEGDVENGDHRSILPTADHQPPVRHPPYRPLDDVLATDQSLFEIPSIVGTMVGFSFPSGMREVNLPGFHLHLLADDRSTGGHIYDYATHDVEVTIGTSRTVHLELPERNLADTLTLPDPLRSIHLRLVRAGSSSGADLADALDLDADLVTDSLRRLVNRGMAERVDDGDDPPTPATRFRSHLAPIRPSSLPAALDDL
ncbi:MAG: acetolactate decarboxylase [Acidimicrobiia bacterium]|nr:acetolactate decarboxylase [Acidimicrobiia bacterium]